MIYLDTSVILAQLLGEPRLPPPRLWGGDRLVTSRLAHYEVWNRLYAYRASTAVLGAATGFLARFDVVELTPANLTRALEPFPVSLKTLDALHLASVEFLRGEGAEVALASYDKKMQSAATALGIDLYTLD